MRIGIDAHDLGKQSGGNETFVRQLLQGFSNIGTGDLEIVALIKPDLDLLTEGVEGVSYRRIPTRSSWLRVPFALPYLARKLNLDILQVQYSAPPYTPCPYIVAMHDMVWKSFPETLPPLLRHRLNLLGARTARSARRIFTITEAIRQQVHTEYHIPLDRIDVVGCAVDPQYKPIRDVETQATIRAKYHIDGPYILYVGALQPRKNLIRLARAFARLKDRGLPHRLVFTGKRTYYGPMAEELESLQLGDRLIYTGYVDTEDLPVLMSTADAFAYISLYEGFGIPVVEALACGTPVLISHDPALVEISAGTALTCDPLNIDAIEDGLVRLLTDEALRERARKKGPERAQYYSCERAALAALEGYRKALT